MQVYANLRAEFNGSTINVPTLLPTKGCNIKSLVLAEMLRKYPKEAVIVSFVDLSGSALIMPGIAKQFPNITFVVIITNSRCSGLDDYRNTQLANFKVMTLNVYKGKVQLQRDTRRATTLCDYDGRYVALKDINRIVDLAVTLLGYDAHVFGFGVDHHLFMFEMINHFKVAFQSVDFSNIKRIMIVGGTANTCEAMCYGLRANIPVIVTEVGGNFNKNRKAFGKNVEFFWPDVPYTSEFVPEMLDFNPELVSVVQSLIELNPEFACDPYCGKLFFGYKSGDFTIDDISSTLHVFVRNGK
jgi:hypothetical protein